MGGARSLGSVLWVSAGAYRVNYPTPVFIEAKTPASLSLVVLQGWRCSDGRVLRFWAPSTGPHDYRASATEVASREQPFKHVPVSAAALAAAGKLTYAVRPRALHHGVPCGQATPCLDGGYLLFSSPGKWVVQGEFGSKVVGTAVFDLPG
jgi:hypothetical protein